MAQLKKKVSSTFSLLELSIYAWIFSFSHQDPLLLAFLSINRGVDMEGRCNMSNSNFFLIADALQYHIIERLTKENTQIFFS